MRTRHVVIAAAIAAAALSASAQPRMESAIGPFTYEAVGATPSLSFGRTRSPKAADAASSAETPAIAPRHSSQRATSGTFTYDALGATPHVQVRKPAATEATAPQPVR